MTNFLPLSDMSDIYLSGSELLELPGIRGLWDSCSSNLPDLHQSAMAAGSVPDYTRLVCKQGG